MRLKWLNTQCTNIFTAWTFSIVNKDKGTNNFICLGKKTNYYLSKENRNNKYQLHMFPKIRKQQNVHY